MEPAAPLPAWATEVAALYESGAASQFILYGDIGDRFWFPTAKGGQLGDLREFFLGQLLPGFDVVVRYDLGSGIRVDKGAPIFAEWQRAKERPQWPREPRAALEWLTQYFRFCANVAELGQRRLHIACVVDAAHLVAPAGVGGRDYELSAMALMLREWSVDRQLRSQPLATFLLTENLIDLHPLLVQNGAAARVKVPLPTQEELRRSLRSLASSYPNALKEMDPELAAQQLRGAQMTSIERLLKEKEHARQPLRAEDLATMRQELVERDTDGLIEFIEPTRNLSDVHGQEPLKEMLRQDFALWRSGESDAMPMGYLVSGPVGTGKTFLVECLAGEAGVPVVKVRNFRDRWVGSTEGNLEKIFRLLQALGRCIVFIDEADQALGRREAAGNDGGLSGRVYSMFATEMSRVENRGRLLWVLATSRPDLVEVDLKRPGRIDVKIPILPAADEEEGFQLLSALCSRRGLDIGRREDLPIPEWLTPGAAEALAARVFRKVKAEKQSPREALQSYLRDYGSPVLPEVMEHQIRLAVREASDLAFVPAQFRGFKQPPSAEALPS